jgi:hypothetical protein
VAITAPFDSDPDHGLGCRAGRPQHGNRGQSLIVDLSHKKRFFGSNLLPDLSNPDLLVYKWHTMRLVRTPASVNCLPRPVFQASLENLFALYYI